MVYFGKKPDTKKLQPIFWNRRFILLFSSFVAVSSALLLLIHTTPTSASGADISKAFHSTDTLNAGQIVSIHPNKADYVKLASTNSGDKVIGVVVIDGEATLEIKKSETKKTYQVATAGRALVSIDPNTSIDRGEQVGIGDRAGVGAKAKIGRQVVGVAEASSGSSEIIGGLRTIPIIVSPGIVASSVTQDNIFARIAGQDVSALQVFFAMAIALVGLIAIGFLTYSSTRGSITAIGRNPLSKSAILGAMGQVMFMVTMISLVCVGLMYMTLRI